MDRDFPGASQKNSSALRDSIILCLITVGVFILVSDSQVYALFSAWYRQHDERGIGALLTAFLILPLAFSIFSLRRWSELRSEVAQHKQEKEKLAYLSTHDPLTCLYNRAYFDAELTRLQRGRQFPIGLVMVDVDHLKVANDTLGHAEGDALLRGTAELLRVTFRAEDVVARIGGDEFAVLMPNTNAEALDLVLVRIENNLVVHNLAHTGFPLRLSVGVATAEKGTELIETLRQADERMYRDKLARSGLGSRYIQDRSDHFQAATPSRA
ncbi:MAG: GGDEF domain-containing protein [Chloroflexi bacterium]|nr:GGDEF domain-containing protein [Chloroflexota bacterium]